ncbi:hypothetical protein [Nesterenkonia haasae]|uniref:hypothetical protein n=1 Tax=Nesterenkonia haasae TaxID=2587813 RepID=UPI001390ED08|nr:hypothetical protein [Nesterenkonia haasae]NDK31018.1 hypothetical protein [Nesterenkonia haasae]
MTHQEWIITVDDEHVQGIDEVVDALEAVGFRASGVLRSLGQVTGETTSTQQDDESLRQALAAVAGVASVDAARRYRVAPSDSD